MPYELGWRLVIHPRTYGVARHPIIRYAPNAAVADNLVHPILEDFPAKVGIRLRPVSPLDDSPVHGFDVDRPIRFCFLLHRSEEGVRGANPLLLPILIDI